MKNQNTETEPEKKSVTRYDQKMEKRRIQAEKNAKNDKIFNLACKVVGVAIIAAIVVGVATSVINKNKVTKDTYIQVGNHSVTQLEFDYYKNMTITNYINSYGQFLQYMGLDTSKDYAEQKYSDTMTWKDAFDEMAASRIIQSKALNDDAAANGFTADVNAQYDEFATSVAQTAPLMGLTESKYYKITYGPYATKANIAPLIKADLLGEAYSAHLLETNAPTEAEISEYYQEHKNDYDKVSFRSYLFTADLAEDATEEQITAAMEQTKTKAEEMEGRRVDGAEFRALCLEYAADDQKATYENPEQDGSYTEQAGIQSVPAAVQSWMFDESRVSGDLTVLEDAINHSYYVVEFVDRTYDDTTNETISSTIANERVSEHIMAISENYKVTDVAGDLKYLTVRAAESAAAAAGEETAADGAAGTDAAAETEAAGSDTAESEAPTE